MFVDRRFGTLLEMNDHEEDPGLLIIPEPQKDQTSVRPKKTWP
jgi:hypothetical protein